jgi:hypothetical protein
VQEAAQSMNPRGIAMSAVRRIHKKNGRLPVDWEAFHRLNACCNLDGYSLTLAPFGPVPDQTPWFIAPGTSRPTHLNEQAFNELVGLFLLCGLLLLCCLLLRCLLGGLLLGGLLAAFFLAITFLLQVDQ